MSAATPGTDQLFDGRFERVRLPGDVALHLAPSTKFKTCVVKVFVRTDLRAETATEVALLPYVLRHGSRSEPTMRAVNRRLEALYGTSMGVDVLKLGEQQVLTFRLELLGDAFLPEGVGVFEPALRLLAGLLTDPARGPDGGLVAAAVEQEKQKLQRFVEGLVNDKGTYAAEACIRTMCRGEPYSVFEYGDPADLARLDGATLEARRSALLTQAPLDVYVAGAFDPAAARALVTELFALERRPGGGVRGTTPHPARREPREVREPMAVKQAKLVLGLRSGVRLEDPGYWAFLLMNGILGGFPHSKLFRNVREKAGLCYDASSSYERFKGLLFVSAGIDREQFERTRDMCLEQLAAIGRGEVTEDELEWTRASYQQSYRALLDAPTGLVNLDYSMHLGGRSGAPAEGSAAVEAVTKDEVCAAAREAYLDTVYLLEPVETA